MRKLVQLGFVVGFAAVAVVAYLLPGLGYERYPSRTNMIINGGRAEQFVVRLPADRIYAAGRVGGPAGAASPVAEPWPDVLGLPHSAGARVEHYKLRDVDGNVIGMAVRHSAPGTAGPELAWMLTIPSRGSVVFAGDDSGANAVEDALAGRGWQSGEEFDASVSITRVAQLGSVQSVGEFSGLGLDLVETWEVTGVDSEGELRGTIRLDTTGRRL